MSATDRSFDELLPAELRHLSQAHWTPVDVAIRATSLLHPSRHDRVLDVGAGVGKLCTIGALSSPAIWCGVEQHGLLVATARRLARALGVADRTMFLHADAFAIEWSEFDALYLYNPFELPLFPAPAPDGERALDFTLQIARVEDRLARLRPGTRVLTLHGFGGAMPPTFDLLYQERVPFVGLDLVLWIQRSQICRRRELS
jgi:hypothetical protein